MDAYGYSLITTEVTGVQMTNVPKATEEANKSPRRAPDNAHFS